ncbi:MAG: hypothetical protein PHR11_02850, partial [Candidatus Omnitrophica bacterium]|nr:hypothetical protein [Candidatus Omnitrophota bacterium]
EVIDRDLKDALRSVLLLESLIPSTPEQARQVLLEVLPVMSAEAVLRILFYTPPRACFVVENTMLPKMPAISYLGNWDFSKVYIAQNFNSQEKDRILDYLTKLGRNTQQVQTFYQEGFLVPHENLDAWLSRRLQFYGPLVSGRENEGVVFFDNGFVYNPKDQTISSSQGQIPRTLFYYEEGKLLEKGLSGANAGFSAMVAKDDSGTYKCLLLDRELGGSLLVRLYLFKGKGMRHFVSFIDAEDGNNFIRVFNIAW